MRDAVDMRRDDGGELARGLGRRVQIRRASCCARRRHRRRRSRRPRPPRLDAGERAEGGACADWFDFIRAPPRAAEGRAAARAQRLPVTGAALAARARRAARRLPRAPRRLPGRARGPARGRARPGARSRGRACRRRARSTRGEALAAFAQRFSARSRSTRCARRRTGPSRPATARRRRSSAATTTTRSRRTTRSAATRWAARRSSRTTRTRRCTTSRACCSACTARAAHTNSLVGGFAVAHALRERHPALFDALRDDGARAGGARRLLCERAAPVETAHRVLQTDPASGDAVRVRFHEAYRAPLAVPYEQFERYWEALATFHAMAHAPSPRAPRDAARGRAARAQQLAHAPRPRRPAPPRACSSAARAAREAAPARASCACAQAGLAPGDDVGLPTRVRRAPTTAGSPSERTHRNAETERPHSEKSRDRRISRRPPLSASPRSSRPPRVLIFTSPTSRTGAGRFLPHAEHGNTRHGTHATCNADPPSGRAAGGLSRPVTPTSNQEMRGVVPARRTVRYPAASAQRTSDLQYLIRNKRTRCPIKQVFVDVVIVDVVRENGVRGLPRENGVTV